MNIALFGYGKMGKTIDQLIAQSNQDKISLIVEMYNQNEYDKNYLLESDVVIEFTEPHSALKNIETALEAGKPIVVGTTGWQKELAQVQNMVTKYNGAVLYASNFSIGVNLLFMINKVLAKSINSFTEYKCQIQEVHHLEKKDKPSGTAISLAEGIIMENDHWSNWTIDNIHRDEELLILCDRKQDVYGDHEVTWSSEVDTLKLAHYAHSREGFARGAIAAAHWLVDKKGLFTMQDMLADQVK